MSIHRGGAAPRGSVTIRNRNNGSVTHMDTPADLVCYARRMMNSSMDNWEWAYGPGDDPVRCPECHMPVAMHHDPGCSQPCERCGQLKQERVPPVHVGERITVTRNGAHVCNNKEVTAVHLEAGGHWMARVSHPCGASWYQVPADPDGDVRVIIHPPETEPPETFYGA